MEVYENLIWILILVVAVGSIAVFSWGSWGGCMLGMFGFGFGWYLMFIVSLMFLVLIFLGVYYVAVVSTRTSKSRFIRDERPLEILKERYARGEITREELEL